MAIDLDSLKNFELAEVINDGVFYFNLCPNGFAYTKSCRCHNTLNYTPRNVAQT